MAIGATAAGDDDGGGSSKCKLRTINLQQFARKLPGGRAVGASHLKLVFLRCFLLLNKPLIYVPINNFDGHISEYS